MMMITRRLVHISSSMCLLCESVTVYFVWLHFKSPMLCKIHFVEGQGRSISFSRKQEALNMLFSVDLVS